MKKSLLQWLSCPKCFGKIVLIEETICLQENRESEIETGNLQCISCKSVFPIIDNIPRFVPRNNYTNNFGFEWNLFRKTTHDDYTNTAMSKDKFFRLSGWDRNKMKGATVLDAGCGSGRFAEVALSTGATVFAVDQSGSVDVCWDNLRDNPNLHVIQADINTLPFKPCLFDYIYCIGVLQHTPKPKNAFSSLAKKLKNKGKLCVDCYGAGWKIFFWSKYWIRPITKNMAPELLFSIVKRFVPLLLPISQFLNRTPRIGYYLKYAIPIANNEDVYLPHMDKQRFLEWSILETFDMYSPKYDFPQTPKKIRSWFVENNFLNIQVFGEGPRKGLVVGRGVKSGLDNKYQ